MLVFHFISDLLRRVRGSCVTSVVIFGFLELKRLRSADLDE
jgi:hypothetical protein